jgi:hypothetical protein
LLEANPLDDIRNTEKISAVVANGRLVAKSELRTMLANVEAAANKRSKPFKGGTNERESRGVSNH